MKRTAFAPGLPLNRRRLVRTAPRATGAGTARKPAQRPLVAGTTASNGAAPVRGIATRKRRGGALPGDPAAPKHNVTILNYRDDESLTLAVPEDRYIWWYFRENGYELPSSCLNGCCTTCAAKIVRGSLEQPEALGLTREFRDKGYCLLCVSYPRSALVLVLQSEDEVYEQQWATTFESGGKRWGGLIPEED
ncbi:probable ferredoxin [Cyanidioschyzon merolae strain 10D]|jgi:ferredoxin|uniref:Probable ferredoxin n=1 Tax=Cyanidioschyzon merolae (strain NIES-3377 / 10D) TaxID=280699 RepID=M1V5H0_CYAM1|nr:similar to ferredoxin [Cyanidioschyzon merolae strain 10D]XP_005538534.1 probable ferredoxin [Cyanidioschyzon merolae strain 10D]BAM80655.1 similar to ferredoxin [Cyanidioschyzon merolae strain 10D]BAM82498.1 probable ferredoxin [Cyanidioschyzon merolae strain 10D]|eukprot:XP_005536691.1 similar to ferredoxin [Cyanidioschyzon merolae strain 10D]